MTEFINLAKEVGFPGATLIVIGFALWRVGKFLGPHVEGWFAGQQELMTALKTNDDKHTETLTAIASQGQSGHAKTHDKLDAVHADVKHIKERFQ